MWFNTGLGAVLSRLTLAHTELFLWGKQQERHYRGRPGFLYLVGAFLSLSRFLGTVLAWSFPLPSSEGQASPGRLCHLWTLLLGNETSSWCHLYVCLSYWPPLQALEFCFWRCITEVLSHSENGRSREFRWGYLSFTIILAFKIKRVGVPGFS